LPSRTHNRRDRSPGCRLCYVTEQYGPRIGYLQERLTTSRYILSSDSTKRLLTYNYVMTTTVLVILNSSLKCDAPMTLAETMRCRSVAADRCPAATGTVPSCMLSVAPYAMQTCAASVRGVDCFRTRKGGPTTTVLLISMLHHVTHVKALELTGWRRRLMSLLSRVLRRRGSVARSCSRPRGRPDMRTLSLRAARHPLSQPRGGHT
jgi:hypothetical protein